MQELLRDPIFGQSPKLWQSYIAWLRKDELGRISSNTTVQHVRTAYNDALKVCSTTANWTQMWLLEAYASHVRISLLDSLL